MITSSTCAETTIFYGVKDGLKYREVKNTPQGNIINTIKSYEEVDNYKFSKAINQSIGNQSFDVLIKNEKANTKIENAVFEN